MNKDLLNSFVPIENQIKDAIDQDVISIEKFLKKRKRVVDYWKLDRDEIKCLRLLLKNLHEIKNQNNEEILIFGSFTFEIKADVSRIDVHDFREIIRNFATETLRVLVKNNIEVGCELTNKTDQYSTEHLIIECI
jgi:archaellum biogenesis ATPase FlaH